MAISPGFALVPAGEPGLSLRFSPLYLLPLFCTGTQKSRPCRPWRKSWAMGREEAARLNPGNRRSWNPGRGSSEQILAAAQAEVALQELNLTAQSARNGRPARLATARDACCSKRWTSGGGSGCSGGVLELPAQKGPLFFEDSTPRRGRVQPIRRTTQTVAPGPEHHHLPDS